MSRPGPSGVGGRGEAGVVVIGGGLAGITAALDCAEAGCRVTLVERTGRLGGATWSFTRRGATFDNGQHVFLRCCSAYRDLLQRLRVAHLVHLQDRLDIPVLRPGRPAAHLRRAALPVALELAPALLSYGPLSLAERLGVARAARALAGVDRSDPATDAETFGHWLRVHHQSARAIAWFWDVITRPTTNLPADSCSLSVAATVFQIGLLEGASASDIGWSRVPLGRLHGEAAERALSDAGVEVRLETRAGRLEETPVGWRVPVAGGGLEADAVVVAVPHDEVAELVPPGHLHLDPAALGHSAIVNVQMVFDRPVLPFPLATTLDPRLQWLFDRSEAVGIETGQCVGVSLSAADRDLAVTPGDLIRRTRTALAALLPTARDAVCLDAVVTKERHATFRATAGSARWRLGPQTDAAGLALAGAWSATGWPATMEGAVRSGHAAARVVAAAVERDRWQPKEAAL